MPKTRVKIAATTPKKIVRRAARTRAPVIAAVDLGSNSFHLVIAKVENGEPIVVDKLREMLRFGSGLDGKQRIKPTAAKAALACLQRFGERLALWRPELVRAVGTNTLRQAANAEPFLTQAEQRLGVPVEVISGVEEARLIYRGVSPDLTPEARVLVVDIGGGSTELIVGAGDKPVVLESVVMGCVTMTDRFLAGHLLNEARFAQAIAFARQNLAPLRARLRGAGWGQVVGSSGTIRAVDAVARELGLVQNGLTPTVLLALKEQVLRQRHARSLVLPGLASERAPVFAGGLAILMALFEVLDIQAMKVTKGALREGVLRDLMARLGGADVRAEAVARFATRWPGPYDAPARGRALALVQGVAAAWRLSHEDQIMLDWALTLHACGLAVNPLRYEHHSAYIVAHAELAGFAPCEQQRLAALIALQRGKWTRLGLAAIKKSYGPASVRLAVLLRLSLAFLRIETYLNVPAQARTWRLSARGNLLEIRAAVRAAATRDALWRELGPELTEMQKGGLRFLLGV